MKDWTGKHVSKFKYLLIVSPDWPDYVFLDLKLTCLSHKVG